MTITLFNAGHMSGGTILKIRSPSVGTIMYTVNMNVTSRLNDPRLVVLSLNRWQDLTSSSLMPNV